MNYETKWLKVAKKQLLGKRIVRVRYLTEKEMESLGWHCRCVVLQLDDGNLIFPAADEEGNDAGVFFTNDKDNNVLPTL